MAPVALLIHLVAGQQANHGIDIVTCWSSCGLRLALGLRLRCCEGVGQCEMKRKRPLTLPKEERTATIYHSKVIRLGGRERSA